MFTETREMIDSTVYINGRGEVTAQNINLAMHGMLDATEDVVESVNLSIESVDEKIDNLAKVVEENAEGAVGLSFDFPLLALELIYDGDMLSLQDAYIDRETANEIVAEFPMLAEPFEKIFENNAKAYQKYVDAVSAGEPAPIVSINMGSLAEEFYELEGFTGASMSYVVNPTAIMSSSLLLGPYIMMLLNFDGIMSTMAVLADGTIGFMEANVPANINVPMPGEAYVDNSVEVDYLNYALYDPNHSFLYSDGNGEFSDYLFPSRIYTNGNYIYVRFVIGSEVIEACINRNSGATISRVIATMTPIDVEELPDGKLTKMNDLSYSYYDPIPATGGYATIGVECNVAWKLIKNGTVAAVGESTKGATLSILVEENTTGEAQTIFFSLVSNPGEDKSGIQLAQVTYTQNAS